MLIKGFLRQVRLYSTRGVKKPTGNNSWHDPFGKHLLFTNTWTSGVLMVAGDLIEQEVEYQRNLQPERYDWGRVGRMFITGLGLGPLHHYFYGWMDKALPQRSMRAVTKKILLDQFIMSPVCIAFLFYSMGTMEGKSPKGSTEEFKKKFWNVYLMDWVVWPPAQFLNFYYIPVKYQVLYINAVTMIYNVFLSYIKHKDTVFVPQAKAAKMP